MTLFALLSAVAVVLLAWGSYAFPGVVSLTASAVEACKSLLALCLDSAHILKLALMWSAISLASSGIVYACFRAAASMIRAGAALSALPSKQKGAVVLITDDTVRTAFTAGLLRPRIYISTGLMKGLEKDELRAVFVHELRHRRSFDPLKFLVYGFLSDAFFYLPLASHLASSARLRREHEADDEAAERLGGPVPVAAALIKAARRGASFAPAMAGAKDDVAGRIRRLIEGRSEARRLPAKALATSVVLAAALIVSLSVPIYAGAGHECTLERCERHADMIEDCRAHCSTEHGRHGAH